MKIGTARGITHLRCSADFAAPYQVRTGCHGASDLWPACTGAALLLDTWVPSLRVQEQMHHTERPDDVFPHA